MSMSVPKFDLSQLFGDAFTFDTSGSYQTDTVYVVKAELLYEVIRAHVMIMENPKLMQSPEMPTDIVGFFTGFVKSPQHLTWYSDYNPNKIVERAAMAGAKEGNTFAVAELLTVDHNNLPRQRNKKG